VGSVEPFVKTVLITGIGGDIAQGVATVIRATFPDWRLLGTDIHDRHGGSLFADKIYRGPAVASTTLYDQFLADVIRREAIDLCIPMSEAELIYLAERPDAVVAPAVLLMPCQAAVRIGSDKLLTAEFLGSLGLPRPWTIPADAMDASTVFPCMFKVRRSAGSKGVFLCESAADVEFYRARHPAAILQELLLPADREVTCAVFRSRDGRIAVVQLLRTLLGGFTGWAEVIDDPEVAAQCRTLATALNLRGSINVQLRLTAAGPRIFEINPRFSSTALMRHHMGFRDVVWSIQDALDQDISLFQPPRGTTASRIQGAALLDPLVSGSVL
jgi:carbamoyl-phosphate synthase large subunit